MNMFTCKPDDPENGARGAGAKSSFFAIAQESSQMSEMSTERS